MPETDEIEPNKNVALSVLVRALMKALPRSQAHALLDDMAFTFGDQDGWENVIGARAGMDPAQQDEAARDAAWFRRMEPVYRAQLTARRPAR